VLVGVTGGTGDLGRAVVAQLLAAGHDVRASHLTSTPPASLESAEWVRMDLEDAAGVRSFVEDCEAVVHTAFRGDVDALQPLVVEGTRRVAAAARRAGARLVHVSTDIVFAGRELVAYREEDPLDPVTAYGQAKAETERLVMSIDPDAVMIRPSLMWSADHDDHQSAMVRRAVSSERPMTFFTDEHRCPSRTQDVAAVVGALLANPYRGPLHVGGRDRVSRYELARLLARSMDLDPELVVGAEQDPDDTSRPRDVALDSSLAERVVGFALPGARELLGGPGTPGPDADVERP
jgi:dTDP-4-dehydrorhamnose reductase